MRRTPRDGGTPSRRRPTGNLPLELNRFVGRTAELAELGGLLAGARMVTVTGTGGVGKSRLALRAAKRLQDRFCGGIWLVELSALRAGHPPEHAVLEALGLTATPGRPPRAELAGHLADREVLVVLDGCEHMAAACARLAGDLLRRVTGLTVLATSRRPLDVEGEHVFPLAPMPAPKPAPAPSPAPSPSPAPPSASGGGAAASEAALLFADRARAVVPGFDAAGRHAAAVAELCHRLDGIPLALELAASGLRALSMDQLLHRLDDRFRLLSCDRQGALPRHRSLRTAIGWSHELCSPEARLLWARLSVFAGDFDLDAAEYLCSGDGLPADEVLGVLTELVAQSVVVREETCGRVRYRMLDTVREYGARWLAELGDDETLRRRHRDWYLGLATWCELDWFSPRQREVARRIEEELPNLRLALEYCLESPEEAHVGQYLAATLWFSWVACGRVAEGRHWLQRALALDGGSPEPRAKALWVAGLVSVVCGEPVAALGALNECLRVAESCGDEAAGAHARQMLALVAAVGDDMPRAVQTLRHAVARFRDLGELDSLVLLAHVQLSMTLTFTGQTWEAVELAAEAHDVAEDTGERWVQSWALLAWSYALCSRGEREQALRLGLAGLAIGRGFHDVLGMTTALEHIAPLVVAEDPALAARVQGAATAGWRTFGAERFGCWHFEDAHLTCAKAARRALGDEGYEEELRRGRARGPAALADELLASAPAQRQEERGACDGGPRLSTAAGGEDPPMQRPADGGLSSCDRRGQRA